MADEINQNDLQQYGSEEELEDLSQEELEAKILKLTSYNEDLKIQYEKSLSKNRSLKAAVARQEALEAKVASLRHDLASARRESRDADRHMLELSRELEVKKARVEEKEIALATLDKGIQDLNKNAKALMQNGWKIEDIEFMRKILNENQKNLRYVEDLYNIEGPFNNGEKKRSIGWMASDWLWIGSISMASLAVLGSVYYVHAARKY